MTNMGWPSRRGDRVLARRDADPAPARAANRVGPAELRVSYRVATTLPAVILVLFWIFRDRLTWNILLPGLAWRSFVVLSALPMALAVWGSTRQS